MYLSLSNQTLSSIMSHTDQYRAIHLIYNAFNLCLLGNEYLTSFIVKVHNIFKNVFYIEYMFIILFMIFLCLFQSKYTQFSSVQFICSVVSESLRPHELQHARPSCPSPSPGVHSDSRPSSLWCHPAISSSVVPFSSCPQSLPASEPFRMSQLFAWGGQVLEIQL